LFYLSKEPDSRRSLPSRRRGRECHIICHAVAERHPGKRWEISKHHTSFSGLL